MFITLPKTFPTNNKSVWTVSLNTQYMIREINLKIDWNKIILNNFLSPDRQRDSERMNKTAISMSKTLMENHKPNWKDYTKKKPFHIIKPKIELLDTHLIFFYLVKIVVYPSIKFLKYFRIFIILKITMNFWKIDRTERRS